MAIWVRKVVSDLKNIKNRDLNHKGSQIKIICEPFACIYYYQGTNKI
mgnify:CR=1 FL=1